MGKTDRRNREKQVMTKYADNLPIGDVSNQQKYRTSAEGRVRELFVSSKSKILEEQFKNVVITKIENLPVTVGILQTQYEQREIYDSCTPSSKISTSSQHRHNSADYSAWDITMKEDPVDIVEEQHIQRVEGTDYLEDCPTCGATGRVHCHNCSNGYETCPTCHGHGNLNCGYCGGRGIVKCGTCNGIGTTRHVETIFERDNEGREWPVNIDVDERCYHCGGSGEETCSNCGGDGIVRCNTCRGSGEIVCTVCGGTTYLTCRTCSGYGYLLHEVMVKQSFRVNSLQTILGSYHLPDWHRDYKIRTDEKESYKQIAEITEGNNIENIPWQNIFPQHYITDISIIEKTEKVLEAENYKISEDRPVRQRISVYQKDLLDITYQLGGKEFNLLADLGNGDLYTPDSPFDDIVRVEVDRMEEAVKQEHYHDFYELYEDIKKVTVQDKNLGGYDSRMQQMYKRITNLFTLYLFAGYAGDIIFDVILRILQRQDIFQTLGFWATAVIPPVMILIVKKYWYKLKLNSKVKLVLVAAGGAFIFTLLLKLLFWKMAL